MDRRAITLLGELARDAASPVVIRGDCMQPLLRSGATVTVKAKRWYWPGDVVVFRTHSGDLAAHRVLGWRPAGFVTKGDHCVLHDAPVPRREIVGAVNVPVGVGERLRTVAALARIVFRKVAG